MYLTVGNLLGLVRNSNKRLGTILLALLLVIKDGDSEQRARLYYECMRRLFNLIIEASDGEGLNIACIDG